MGEGKYVNDSGDIILGVPAIYEKEDYIKNAYEIGRGWPHYKDFDFSDENFEFMGEVLPFFTFEAASMEFPPPLEAENVTGVSEAGASEANISEIGLSKVGVSEVGLSKVGVSETGVGKVNVSEVGVSRAGVSEVSVSNASASEVGLNKWGDGIVGASSVESGVVVSGKTPNTAQVGLLSLDELDKKLKGINDLEGRENKEISLMSIDEASALPGFIPSDFVTCSLDEVHLRLNGLDTKDIDLCSFDIIDNSLYSQDGVDKINYSDAVITGFNLDIGAGSADFDIDMRLLETDVKTGEKPSVSLISQISKRLLIFVKRVVSESGYRLKDGTSYNKEAISGIVDNIMDKMQNEIDEAEDISFEVQRTDWSRYRLLRAVAELLVVMELNCQIKA